MISVLKLQTAIPALARLNDAELAADLEARALALVATQTNRYFGEPASVTEFLIGNGSDYLRLSETAVADDSSDDLLVEERCLPCRPGGTLQILTIQPVAYELRDVERGSLLRRVDGRRWRNGIEYAVTYRRGYPIDGGPKDIEQLVIDLIGLRLNLLGKEGLSGEQIGGYSWTKRALAFEDGDLRSLPGAIRTLGVWRRPVLA
jgi:hypothetical protein